MKIAVRFMSLEGPFKQVKTETFDDPTDALNAVKVYAQAAGYTNVKINDEGDMDGIRYVAKTPNGRGGRNVAFGDWDGDFS